MQQNLRTQIYLPRDLRGEIDKQRAQTGESLAEYLRKAAEEKVKKDKKRGIDLKSLAEEVVGAVDPKKSAWAGLDVMRWQHEMRKAEDEHRFGKLNK